MTPLRERESERERAMVTQALRHWPRTEQQIRISESEGRKEAEMVRQAEKTARRNRGQKK